MEFTAHDLEIGVVTRQQPSQEPEVCLVQLLFGANTDIESADLRRKAQIIGDLRDDVPEFGLVPRLAPPVHARALERIFRGELQMLKEVEFIRELFADEIAEGRAEGEARASRRILLGQLQTRFGALPEHLAARIEAMDAAECEALALRLMNAGSLAELGL